MIIWQERQGAWGRLTEFTEHTASVNSVSWSPHEIGALLACASTDGKVSVLEFKDDGSWDKNVFVAHGTGVNSVSWAPANQHTSSVSAGQKAGAGERKFVTGGSDGLVKIWKWNGESYVEEATLEGHTDWVRGVTVPSMVFCP